MRYSYAAMHTAMPMTAPSVLPAASGRPKYVSRLPVYDGWRMYLYGPSTTSLAFSRTWTRTVKCLPRMIIAHSRNAIPATARINPAYCRPGFIEPYPEYRNMNTTNRTANPATLTIQNDPRSWLGAPEFFLLQNELTISAIIHALKMTLNATAARIEGNHEFGKASGCEMREKTNIRNPMIVAMAMRVSSMYSFFILIDSIPRELFISVIDGGVGKQLVHRPLVVGMLSVFDGYDAAVAVYQDISRKAEKPAGRMEREEAMVAEHPANAVEREFRQSCQDV